MSGHNVCFYEEKQKLSQNILQNSDLFKALLRILELIILILGPTKPADTIELDKYESNIIILNPF